MSVKVSAKGLSQLVHDLGSMPAGAEGAVRKVVTATTMQVAADVKQSIQRGPKTGRVYSRGRGRFHQASAPGEAPASDSGTLASRVFHETHDSGISGTVFSDVDYAGKLEAGNERIAPRPYFGPALDKNAASFVRHLEIAVTGALLKGKK
jgi:hypothetical protein